MSKQSSGGAPRGPAPERVLRALARVGLLVRKEGPVYSVSHPQLNVRPARVLLPEGFSLDRKALLQLSAFAGVEHPAGGRVCAACATPDFHAGSLVPVGAVVATSLDLVIPQAIGTDIQCGVRLHVADLDVDAFEARKAEWLDLVYGDLFLGTRDLPMSVRTVRALFEAGALGWLEATRADPLGLLARTNLDQLEAELERNFGLGSADGDARCAPRDLLPADREVIRDSCMGTVGGGNHFIEIQVVEELIDRATAFEWGIRKGQIGVMVHSGSRRVGGIVGGEWIQRARELWPADARHPPSGIFALQGAEAARYLSALNTAANYASVNRLLLAEMMRDRLRQVYGDGLEVPLVYDVPHNTLTREGDCYVHRKGATPAHFGQPVLIPGSMGQASYLLRGEGNAEYLSSASHGAGRARTRGDMRKRAARGETLGLDGVECIGRAERVIEEAPAAYKAIEPVVQVQADVGIAAPVARLKPLLTFKA